MLKLTACPTDSIKIRYNGVLFVFFFLETVFVTFPSACHVHFVVACFPPNKMVEIGIKAIEHLFIDFSGFWVGVSIVFSYRPGLTKVVLTSRSM